MIDVFNELDEKKTIVSIPSKLAEKIKENIRKRLRIRVVGAISFVNYEESSGTLWMRTCNGFRSGAKFC